MARRAADRIAEIAERGFVGRAEELARLRALALGPEPGPLVVFVHGPGGIGKSRLLQALAGEVSSEVPVMALDCSTVEPTPTGILEAVSGAAGSPATIAGAAEGLMAGRSRALFLLDHYETFLLVDAWLRCEFLPAVPVGLLTIVAGRDRPPPGWRTDPGWSQLVEEVKLGELAPAEAQKLLVAAGISAEAAARAANVARGHPLALTLAAAALRADPALELTDGPPPAIVGDLVRRILAGLDEDAIAAAEAAAVVRRVTEPLLAALLSRESAREAFGRLRDLPFTTQTSHGLTLHDVARDAIEADLGQRDPDARALLRDRAARHLAMRVRSARGASLWGLTSDLLYLIDHPMVRDAFFSPGSAEHSVESAGPSDHEAITAIACRWEGGAATWLALWLARQARAFRVVRDARGEVAAFFAMAERSSIDAGIVASDPVAALMAEHLERAPLERGERALLVRRGLALDHGEHPSAALGAAWLDVKRSYLELRPRLRRVYVAVTDPGPSAPAFTALGFEPVGVAPGGPPPTRLLAVDMGPASVDGWLSALLGTDIEDVAAAGRRDGVPEDDGPLGALSARELEVLSLLADGLSNRDIADRLVISVKTVGRHLENIYAKLGVRGRARAARVAAESGLTASDRSRADPRDRAIGS